MDQNDRHRNDCDQYDRDHNVPDPNDRDRNVPDLNDHDQNDLYSIITLSIVLCYNLKWSSFIEDVHE